eukprot:12091-Heterococcus_DN1.PRE.8
MNVTFEHRRDSQFWMAKSSLQAYSARQPAATHTIALYEACSTGLLQKLLALSTSCCSDGTASSAEQQLSAATVEHAV